MVYRPAQVYNGSGWDDIGDKRIGAQNGAIPQDSVANLTSDLASKLATTVTTKGDLISRTTSAPTRLAVGSNGQVLTANSGTTTGLEWATPTAPGLAFISTASFTTVSSVNVNSCFSSTYDVYQIVIRLTQQSGDGTLFVRMRTGAGSDISTTTYENANQAITTGSSEVNDCQTSTTAMRICETDSGTTDDRYLISIQMSAPFLSANTVALSRSAYVTGSGSFASRHGAHLNTNNTSYPSFSIIAESGTISGSVSVYGYRK